MILLYLLLIFFQNPGHVLVDFDNKGVAFEPFGSAQYMRSINPDRGTSNGSDYVGAIVYNQLFKDEPGGIYVDLEDPIDLSSGCKIQLKFMAYSSAKFILKIEDSGIPDYQIKKEKQVYKTEGWETLNFSFKPAEGYHDRITIVFFPDDFTSTPFYIDEIIIK